MGFLLLINSPQIKLTQFMSTHRPPTLLASSNKSAQRACRMFETIPQHPPAVSKQMSKKKALLKMLICPLELTSKMSHPFSLGKGQNCYSGQRPRMDTRARKKPGTMEEGLKCNPTVTLTITQSGNWWGAGQGVCVEFMTSCKDEGNLLKVISTCNKVMFINPTL